ncbi:unnamed protein product [Discosporangium mesarthrocarpum]
MCPGRLPCRRFSPAPTRREVCVCAHGIAHHKPTTGLPLVSPVPTPKTKMGSAGHAQAPPEDISSPGRALVCQAASLLDHLDMTGIRALLGLHRTAGSVDWALPPPRRVLLAALNAPHTSQGSSRLTVGGRAMCKHCHRGAEGWWGSGGGTEDEKNDAAERAVLKILRYTTWTNTHVFGGRGVGSEVGPGSTTFEVREGAGYGARWSADGSRFRGFVEPHSADGHARGWRH